MTVRPGAPVVVGVDGSEASRRAVSLAVRVAKARARPLRLVHAFVWPQAHIPLGPPEGGPNVGGLRNQAERIIADAQALVGELNRSSPDGVAGLAVTADVVTGGPAAVLLAEAETAAMLVLGHRGLGGFTGLLVGSVAVQVCAHAPCPVLVARGRADAGGADHVLVGVDGSPAGQATLAFAFEEASWRGVGLTALHAYRYPVSGEPGDMLPLVYDEDQLLVEESEVLSEALAGWSDRYPDVAVTSTVVRDRPAHALVHASEQAGLAVVGSRGHGGFAGLLLGSVSQAMLHHAACPVAIVRPHSAAA
jgi:nucleotide-binding universal stress UspA family protein